jgi:hypothetical protein
MLKKGSDVLPFLSFLRKWEVTKKTTEKSIEALNKPLAIFILCLSLG